MMQVGRRHWPQPRHALSGEFTLILSIQEKRRARCVAPTSAARRLPTASPGPTWERPPDDARCRHGWEACGSSVARAGTTTQGCSAAVAPIIATMEAMTTTRQSRRLRPSSRPWRRCRPTTRESSGGARHHHHGGDSARRRGDDNAAVQAVVHAHHRHHGGDAARQRASPGGGARHRDHGGDAACHGAGWPAEATTAPPPALRRTRLSGTRNSMMRTRRLQREGATRRAGRGGDRPDPQRGTRPPGRS